MNNLKLDDLVIIKIALLLFKAKNRILPPSMQILFTENKITYVLAKKTIFIKFLSEQR